MIKLKLSQTVCSKAAPNTKTWDTEVRGFALFTGASSKRFYFQRTVSGRTVRTNIGAFPEVSCAQARDEAKVLAGEVASGAVAKRLRDERVPTLEQALVAYLANPKIKSENNRRQAEARVRLHMGDWLGRPIDAITKRMCADRHERLSVRKMGTDTRGRATPVGGERVANHVMKTFRAIYNHASKRHELPTCPTIAVTYNDEAPPKTTIEDLSAWNEEVSNLFNPTHQAFYRFLLLTGLRRNEALSLTWEQIDVDHLHLPTTKNGRAFDLPLLDAHHAILEPLRPIQSEFVFAAGDHSKHMTEPARISWSPHMHRRTFATIAMNDAQVDEYTVGRLLNHTSKTITGRAYITGQYKSLIEPMRNVVAAIETQRLNAVST